MIHFGQQNDVKDIRSIINVLDVIAQFLKLMRLHYR